MRLMTFIDLMEFLKLHNLCRSVNIRLFLTNSVFDVDVTAAACVVINPHMFINFEYGMSDDVELKSICFLKSLTKSRGYKSKLPIQHKNNFDGY